MFIKIEDVRPPTAVVQLNLVTHTSTCFHHVGSSLTKNKLLSQHVLCVVKHRCSLFLYNNYIPFRCAGLLALLNKAQPLSILVNSFFFLFFLFLLCLFKFLGRVWTVEFYSRMSEALVTVSSAVFYKIGLERSQSVWVDQNLS